MTIEQALKSAEEFHNIEVNKLREVIEIQASKLAKAREALEKIRLFKLSNFMGPSDMALECVITANTALREIGE